MKLNLVTNESMNRPEVIRWHHRIKERYTPPEGIALSVILPCSARKPYSASMSHMKFKKAIKEGAGKKKSLVHEVILTSPLGFVPRELEDIFPAAHYDTPVTGHWTGREIDTAAALLKDYLKKSRTDAVAHVDGAYRDIAESLGIETTGTDSLLSDDALELLSNNIRERLRNFESGKRNFARESLRKKLDYQFGKGMGEILLPDSAKIKRKQVFLDNKQVGAINPNTGLLTLNLKGGELLAPTGKYTVEISFKPRTNSIFSGGVAAADYRIRPMDQVVVVYNGRVAGVGRAVLAGEEMENAFKGLAVDMKHRIKGL